tara:strand:+ start:182 stop:436 length:255 start_codon:yes stop_codon:yes gene_type:complete
MTTRKDYYDLTKELEVIERKTGAYLTDENIDHQNVNIEWGCGGDVSPNDPEFWARMHSAACTAAGLRAEEEGLDINELMGRIIF